MKSLLERKFIATLLVTGVFLGLLSVWQFSTKTPLESNFPSDEVTAREELIKSFLDEQSYLQSRIVSLRKEIETYQSDLESQVQQVNLEILENLKAKISLTQASGPGLEIILDDSPKSENFVQASDLRDLVNLLNAANADAIAINNQRIVAQTPISSVGTNILVNNSHLAPPFVISAVGDSDIMIQRITNKSLLPEIYERTKAKKIILEIYKKNNIEIPIYNGDLKTNYLNLVEL